MSDKMNKKNGAWTSILNWLKGSRSDFALFVIILVLLNLVSIRGYKRFDITGPKSYSLSQVSKDAVKTIEEPLTVKVFFTDNLPAPYSSVDQYVKDILVEYKNAASSNFAYEYFDMNKPESVKMANGYGLEQVQVQEVKNNEANFKNAYMGMVFVYADQIEKLDRIASTSGLEYDITTTISKIVSTANIMNGLDGKVNLTLYKSEELKNFRIAGFDQIDSKVQEAYSTLNKKNLDRIEFNKIDPDKEIMEAVADKYGLQLINWKNKDGSDGSGIIGLVMEYGENFRVIPMEMVNMIFSYAISGLDNLEDNLSANLQSLVSRTNKIGYVTGHGEGDIYDDQRGAGAYRSIMDDMYTLVPLNLAEVDIPSEMESIIINGPKTSFTDAELYKIDQFLMKGGNLICYVDPLEQDESAQQQYYGQMPQYEEINTGLDNLLNHYGVELPKHFVMDEKCFIGAQQGYGKLNFYYAPLLEQNSLDKKNVITKNLNNLIFLQSGTVDATKARGMEGVKVTSLAKTSNEAWTMKDGVILDPRYINPPQDKSTEKSYDLAVLVEGKFTSAFDYNPVAENQDKSKIKSTNHLAKSVRSGKIYVSPCSYVTNPQYLPESMRPQAVSFVRNTVDYMNGNGDYCLMRTKNLSLNSLDSGKIKGGFAVFAKYFNQFGLAVLVAVAGLIVLLIRQKHRKNIRMKYDPKDSREIENIMRKK